MSMDGVAGEGRGVDSGKTVIEIGRLRSLTGLIGEEK